MPVNFGFVGVMTTAVAGMLYIPITAYASMGAIAEAKAARMLPALAADAIAAHDAKKPIDFLANLANQSVVPAKGTPSPTAFAMIRDKEGFKADPYYIKGEGSYTIGYGSRFTLDNKPVTERTKPVDEVQAQELVNAHMARNVTPYLHRCVAVRVSQEMWDALSVWAYNVGGDAACKSTLLKKLNGGDVYGSYKEFDKWAFAGGVYSKGLAIRRSEEKAKFMASVKKAAALTKN